MSFDDPPPDPPPGGDDPGRYGHPSARGHPSWDGRPDGDPQAPDPSSGPAPAYGHSSGNGQSPNPPYGPPFAGGPPSGNGHAPDSAHGPPAAGAQPTGGYGHPSTYGHPSAGGQAPGAHGPPAAGAQPPGAYGPGGYGRPPAGGPPPGGYGQSWAYPSPSPGPAGAYSPPPPPVGYPPGPPGYGAPPGYPGYGAPWYQAPPAWPRRRQGPIIAVATVAVIGLVAGGVVVLTAGDRYPDEWDSRVSDLVDFVESERGLQFDHAVPVDFLSDEEYSAETRVDESEVTDADRTAMEEDSAALVALGLVPPDLDLLEAGNDLTDSGTLAFYDPTTEHVVVRGDELTPVLQGTLVHELTHVLQDQHFDLDQPPPEETAGAYEAQAAVIEGDAMRMETAWVDTLSAADQDAYWSAALSAGDVSEEELATVPGALQAEFAAPYAFGEPLVTLLALAGGNARVDQAFEDPPVTSEQLIDPRALFAGQEARDVRPAVVPEDGNAIWDEPEALGATTLLVALAERIDGFQALDAVDGWGGDQAMAYRRDGRTCLQAQLVGDTPADTEELYQALDDWVAAGPAGAASVAMDGDQIALQSCSPDPGTGTAPGSTRSLDVLGAVAARSFVMAQAEDAGYDHDVAFGVGNCAVRTATMDVITSDEESAGVAFQHAIEECWPDD
jgi:hypothetical protein